MQIGHQFKVVKHQMAHVLQIIMVRQQDNAFKMIQTVFGIQLLQILAIVHMLLSYLFKLIYQKIAINCLSETYNNANWLSIQSGQTSNGICVANYYGSPKRQCIQNDSNGAWSSIITNPCQRK